MGRILARRMRDATSQRRRNACIRFPAPWSRAARLNRPRTNRQPASTKRPEAVDTGSAPPYTNRRCPGGGIGRRTSFRCWRSQGRGGSSPLLGTTLFPQQDKEIRVCKGLSGFRLQMAVPPMALATTCPFATKLGSYSLNMRMKTALREGAGGRSVSLPPGGQSVTVSVSDEVYGSLPIVTPTWLHRSWGPSL